MNLLVGQQSPSGNCCTVYQYTSLGQIAWNLEAGQCADNAMGIMQDTSAMDVNCCDLAMRPVSQGISEC